MKNQQSPATFTLQQLLPNRQLGAAAHLKIATLCVDSREVKAGDIFVALIGEKTDGRQFISQAIAAGAMAILTDADHEDISWIATVPVIASKNLVQQLSEMAGNLYQHPSKKIRLIGVTGTNGKTTCTLLISQLAALLQKRAGVIGTLGFGLLDATLVAPLGQQMAALQTTGYTTPDPIRVQKILAQYVREKAMTVALEVSSHSLALGRVTALQFDTAIFTNLTQDHLDFHGDITAYGNAKEILLAMPNLRYAIINADDIWAKSLLQKIPDTVNAISFSIQDTGANTNANVYLTNVSLTSSGAEARLHSPWGEADLVSPFIGKFNLSNLLAVITSLCVGGFSLPDIVQHIPQLQAAPGRMQAVTLDASQQDINVIVDYAHTPDALEKTLLAIHEHTLARVWTVFGCGGDRDKTKRPLMGRIAELNSDYIILTNDNPRTEEPSAIAADIIRGLHNPKGCLVIADRAQAIDFAVQQAKPGDVVLVAGKGHEDYQIFATKNVSFSDIRQARLALQRRLARRDIEPMQAGSSS